MPGRNNIIPSKERGRYVVGYEGLYAVSTWGRVFSLRRDKWLKPVTSKQGYQVVVLGGRKPFWVHRLVLTAFRGPRPEGQQCRHLDGNPANNMLSNLRWGTREEDFADRLRYGGKGLKLTPTLVCYIRRSNKIHRTLATELGCSLDTIERARKGRAWAHIPEPIKMFKNHQPKLTPSLVRYIRRSNKTIRALAAEIGCSEKAIWRVKRKLTWKDLGI
jgi:hypothetical protein